MNFKNVLYEGIGNERQKKCSQPLLFAPGNRKQERRNFAQRINKSKQTLNNKSACIDQGYPKYGIKNF
jgi:hypothetical protein